MGRIIEGEFLTIEEKEKKIKELLKEAELLSGTVDQESMRRMAERKYQGDTEGDNKLLQHADVAHVERMQKALKLTFEAVALREEINKELGIINKVTVNLDDL